VSEKEETAWFAAFVIEFVVIFILNAFTLAIYTRNRHLRKPSTYLIINLTVADLLVGTVTGSSMSFELHNQETDLGLEQDFSWQSSVQFTLQELCLVASFANISLISLERLHATLFPFRHCLVGKRVYLIIILCSWLFSLILSSVFVLLYLYASPALLYVYASYSFLIIFILTVSYAIIISTVKNNPSSPNAQPVPSTERKLTVTLFIVTVASFLTILPWVIWNVIGQHIAGSKSCPAVLSHIHYSFDLLFLFNSIVNPLIYAVRMQEFRKAARKLFY
ncbi:unnamed protein product, partial [Porites evermanni]